MVLATIAAVPATAAVQVPSPGKGAMSLDTVIDVWAEDNAEEARDIHSPRAMAERATQWQATALGLTLGEPMPLAGYESPAEALLALAARHDVEPTGDTLDRIHDLEKLPGPTALALAHYVDAFLALDASVQAATQDVDIQALDAGWTGTGTLQAGAFLDDANVDLSRVLSTRTLFLEAALELQEALHIARPDGIQASAHTCTPITEAPAFSISLFTCDNHYTEDVALLLDAGGDDVYHNNAGGSNLAGGACILEAEGFVASAALADFGDGRDAYGDPVAPRGCGANGGGILGSGFLFDGGGHDVYTADDGGTNGGGNLGGVGFLLDQDGHDEYNATDAATNGGGVLGAGLLIDQGGHDHYIATEDGTNGGGRLGVGVLVDESGHDHYNATGSGTNGGGSLGGVGFLLDQGGHDHYNATDAGTNGGGDLGVGFLLDQGGHDHYEDASVDCMDCSATPKGQVGFQVDSDDPPA